jgi:hypothetical protein
MEVTPRRARGLWSSMLRSVSGHRLAPAAAGSRAVEDQPRCGREGPPRQAAAAGDEIWVRALCNHRSWILSALLVDASTSTGAVASGLEHVGRCRLALEFFVRHAKGHSRVGRRGLGFSPPWAAVPRRRQPRSAPFYAVAGSRPQHELCGVTSAAKNFLGWRSPGSPCRSK